jgi:beta-fructofuranosidase
MKRFLLLSICLSFSLSASALLSPGNAADDILVNDFEGEDYGDWTTSGTAFGDGPARANVKPRNRVTGHQGQGLVNTYLGQQDLPTGMLTSPKFTIQRRHINFLIGAGNYFGATCIQLKVGEKVVRSAVGPALKIERKEVLDWQSWDVAEWVGREAVIQIVDSASGGWGHILIDQIVQSDTARHPKLTNRPVVMPRPPVGAASLVPQYTFADTLEEQEEQLKTNPLLLRMNESRAAQADDPHRPFYHYVNPEARLNDPNGLCFWQGRWHLFYQAYPPEDTRQHWGHAVSDDLVHWRDLPLAIYPDPEDKCFSGTTYVEEDRVIAIYHGIAAGTMVAVSSDPLLLNWKKVTGQAVIPLAKAGQEPLPFNIFDPCIWKRDGMYYALTAGSLNEGPGGKPVRAEFLHRSKDLAKWEYLHPFLEDDRFGIVGDDGACPYFWPIGDRHILLHYSHTSGGKYLLGDYDTERDKFVVTYGSDFNFGPSGPGGVHAPSAYPDGKGGVIAIFNMNPALPTKGWNQIMTLPRRLTLIGKDQLGIEPAGDIESLRGERNHVDTMTLPANEEIVLKNVHGNAMELVAEIDPKRASMIELNVLRSENAEEVTRITFLRERGYRDRARRTGQQGVISIDNSRSSILPDARSRPPETAQIVMGKNEPLKLRVFIDKSVVEVFVNDKQCVALRVYPGREDSVGVSLRAQGREAQLKSLDAWQMENIYE